MLTGLSTGFRFQIAVAFCAVAVACFVLLPPTALAIGHDADTGGCLFQAEAVDHDFSPLHDGVMPHDHSAPDSEHHGDHAPAGTGHQADCCDALGALAADGGNVTLRSISTSLHSPAHGPRLLSLVPALPDRPPISLLVV